MKYKYMKLKPTPDDLDAMRDFLADHAPGYRELLESASFVRTEVASVEVVNPKARRTMIIACDLMEKPIEQMTFRELNWLKAMVLALEG